MLRVQRALTARRDRVMQGKGDEGFTLIELLIVVLIIGVLAAIAIPIYINVTNDARDNTAKQNVQSAVNVLGVLITRGDPFPADQAAFDAEFPNTAAGEPGYVTLAAGSTADSFCVQADGNDTNVWSMGSDTAVVLGAC